MKQHVAYFFVILCLAMVNSSYGQFANGARSLQDSSHKNVEKTPWAEGDTNYMALKDSTKLNHIKNQFYRNQSGTLFEKMYAPQDPLNIDAGVIIFFKVTNQDVDPLTFKVIDGDSWFARDKKHVHNYRGNDRGTFCITMGKANVKYFKLMPGDDGGLYGMDNKHVFEEAEIIVHIDPLHMKVITGKDSHMIKIISGRYLYVSGQPKAVLLKTKKPSALR